jgi:hypothetical protein
MRAGKNKIYMFPTIIPEHLGESLRFKLVLQTELIGALGGARLAQFQA